MIDISYLNSSRIESNILVVIVIISLVSNAILYLTPLKKPVFKRVAHVFLIVVSVISIAVIGIRIESTNERHKKEITAQVQMQHGIDITRDVVDKIIETHKNKDDALIETVASETNENTNRLYTVYFQVIDDGLTFYMKVSDVYVPVT